MVSTDGEARDVSAWLANLFCVHIVPNVVLPENLTFRGVAHCTPVCPLSDQITQIWILTWHLGAAPPSIEGQRENNDEQRADQCKVEIKVPGLQRFELVSDGKDNASQGREKIGTKNRRDVV